MKRLIFTLCIAFLCTSLYSQKAYFSLGYNANVIRKDDFRSSLFLDSKLKEFSYFDGSYYNFGFGDEFYLIDIEYAFRGHTEKYEYLDDNGEDVINAFKLTNNTFALMIGGVIGSDRAGASAGLRMDFDHPKYKSRDYILGESKGKWQKIDLEKTLHFRIGPSMKFFFAAENGMCVAIGGYYSWSIGGFNVDTFDPRRHSFGLNLGLGFWIPD